VVKSLHHPRACRNDLEGARRLKWALAIVVRIAVFMAATLAPLIAALFRWLPRDARACARRIDGHRRRRCGHDARADRDRVVSREQQLARGDDRDARCRRALEALSRLQKSIETIWEVDAADDGGIWKTVVRYVVTRLLTSCEVRQHGVSDRHAPLALQQRNIVVFGAKFMQVVSRDRTRRESA